MILTEEMTINTYECYISKYIDGDTIDLNINLGFDTYIIRRIRLEDIDAPEINNTKRNSTENKAGQVALGWLKIYFDAATPPFYLSAQNKGLYGRWLGTIWKAVGEDSLNAFLIEKGYYNSGWSWAVQKDLIEEWYKSPDFHRYGQHIFLDSDTNRMDKGM